MMHIRINRGVVRIQKNKSNGIQFDNDSICRATRCNGFRTAHISVGELVTPEKTRISSLLLHFSAPGFDLPKLLLLGIRPIFVILILKVNSLAGLP